MTEEPKRIDPTDKTPDIPGPVASGAGTPPPEDFASWGRSTAPLPRGIGAGIEAALSSQPRALLWLESLSMVVIFAAIEFYGGSELNFAVFYLIPVIFATWFIGRRTGAFMALLSGGLWASLDLLSGTYYSSPLIFIWNVVVRLTFLMLVMQLIHIMKDARAREAALARTDSLTGVANGRSFSDRASHELALCRRTGDPITMAYMDIDHFKRINDTVGHTEGDRLLRVAAHTLRARLRATDLVARLGGDEFGILLPNTDASIAPGLLEELRSAVREAVDGSWDVGCTIGAVTFEKAPESVDFMVRTADELMYRGKHAGRGRVEHAVWPAPFEEPVMEGVSAR